MREAGLCSIYLVAPTTPDERIRRIATRGSGFVYYISREGVTGMQPQVSANIRERTGLIRSHTNLPIAVGFGISNPDQARAVAAYADAIVVGSAVVNQIAEHGRDPSMVERVSAFVRSLAQAVKAA
jgi:tryptophan synthase alpha chain